MLMIATAVGGWVMGAAPSPGAIMIYPSADGTLRDIGEDGVLQGAADIADWYFDDSDFDGAITLATAEPATTFEDRVVWEYNLATVSDELPVYATFNFTLRGAPALPRPDVEVHVYAYDANLAEDRDLRDYYLGYLGGPPLLQGFIIVPPYQRPTSHSINVSGVVNEALASGANMVGFRFQIDPDTPFTRNQAFIDALDIEAQTKPFLQIDNTSPCDFDGDGEVDLADFPYFVGCMTGPASEVAGDCAAADLNDDGFVDQRDFQAFQSRCSVPLS
jgi:hypothetical protein